MAKRLYEEENIREIACAIREKCGGTDSYKTCDMPDAIRALSVAADPVIRPLEVTQNGTYNVPAGTDGYNPVVVNVATGGSGGNDTGILSGTIAGNYTNNTVTSLKWYAFANCDNLTSVSCPNVTWAGPNMFYECSNLVSVSLPALEETNFYLFYSCPNLAAVDLSGAKTIKTESFWDLPSLTRLDLPSATLIKANAICAQAVSTLILRSPTMCVLENRNGLAGTLVDTTGHIYVPAALLNTYKTDSVWSNFADRFRTIEAYPDICG